MTDRELIENYRMIVIETDTLERQCKFLNNFIFGPGPVRSPIITGMPRGTNEPTYAAIQNTKDEEVLRKLEAKCAELREYVGEFERILDRITDRRLQIIIRDYYALGWSEDHVADHLEISRQHVNRLRTAYLESLDNAERHFAGAV